MGTIAKVTAGGATHLIASSAYGICGTAGNTASKTVSLIDNNAFTLIHGTTIHIRFTSANSADSPTLNVANTGAKPIQKKSGTKAGSSISTS